MPIAAIGIGSNLDDPPAQVRRAINALTTVGEVKAVSGLYRTRPWGKRDQPEFANAVAMIETADDPRTLLKKLKALERDFGRAPVDRWGPRIIDFDVLTYGECTIAEENLQIPHPHLFERAFALIPLAEVDSRYVAPAQALPESERAGVVRVAESESVGPMLTQRRENGALLDRVRTVVHAFLQTDLSHLRIDDDNGDSIEIGRRSSFGKVQVLSNPQLVEGASKGQDDQVRSQTSAAQIERIASDLVGIMHFARPSPKAGDRFAEDRELGFVEALGIRNAVGSRGPGRLAAIRCADGQPVEYGQVLFEIERS